MTFEELYRILVHESAVNGKAGELPSDNPKHLDCLLHQETRQPTAHCAPLVFCDFCSAPLTKNTLQDIACKQ